MLKPVKNIDIEIPGLTILKEIGEGGMSKVYLAEQNSLKREVAVKVMRLEISESDLDVQRFKHEAKTIAQLDHPNIINIYNIGQTTKGEVFYTMPYLNHGDFSNYMIENEQEFIHLLQSVCDGLAFAHARGVVHRDIKPENLLFDEFGNVRIADFGIAITKNGTRMTKEHQIVGSAQYMSPEQARSSTVDNHTDIYSLGIVIYERLTGSVPFDADESISILVNHVSAKPKRLPPKMRHWQKLIDKCLAKNPKNRFNSMLELKEALDKIPTNSIQRTNSSITTVLESNNGKHLKWFIPTLVIVSVLALAFSGKNKMDQPVEIASKINPVVSQAPIETEPTANPVVNEIEKKEPLISEADKLMQAEKQKELIAEENKQQEIQELLTQANKNIDKYQLSKPIDNNATDQLLAVLKIDPENSDAILGVQNIGEKYFQLITSAISENNFSTALKHTKSVNAFNTKTKLINPEFPRQKQQILNSINSLDLNNPNISADNVKTIIKMVKALPTNNLNLALETLNTTLKLKTGPQIGEKLLDEMGIFSILISKKLAVTTHEVTLEEYSEFAESTNRPSSKCKHEAGGFGSFFNKLSWNKPLFEQTPKHPVVCVSQADAQAYSEWLSVQTENNYRLPTKQEWLLFANESDNLFSACETANTAAAESKKSRVRNQNYSCEDKFEFTAPVASFTVNNKGIYDIQGNVSEWIHCEAKSCLDPTAMGSSWYDGKKSNNLKLTQEYDKNMGYSHIGFRLVRDI